MFDIQSVSQEDLLFVINCKQIKELVTRFGEKTVSQVSKQIKYVSVKSYPNNKMSRALLAALTDAPSYPLVMLWTLVGLVALSILPLTFITLGFLGLGFISGTIYFYSHYQELNKEMNKRDKNFQLAGIKQVCMNELCRRKNIQVVNKQLHDVSVQRSIENKLTKNKWHRLRGAIGATVMSASVLFGTYYIGGSSIIAAFGLASVASSMLGPIGIGVMLALALMIGIYFGYKSYQAQKNVEALKCVQKIITNEIDEQRDAYEKFHCKKKINRSQKINAPGSPYVHQRSATTYKISSYPILLRNRRKKLPLNNHFPVPKRQLKI